MKNILLATFLTAIFASGALGQTHWGDGWFYYSGWGEPDSLEHHGVTYFVDSA